MSRAAAAATATRARSAVPARLIPTNGNQPPPTDLPRGAALLAWRIDLDQLVRAATNPPAPMLVDLDEVYGLAPDRRAVTFVLGRLGVAGIITRHLPAAKAAVDAGALTFLKVSALDSTGLERALAVHPRPPGLGTAISPGLVLPYLSKAQRDDLPRPLLAYGLVRTEDEAAVCARAGADAVLLRTLTRASVSG